MPHLPYTSARLRSSLILHLLISSTKIAIFCRFQYFMPRKRKSVTFHQNVSMIYPKTFDGSFSPAPNTTTLATAAQPLSLDPMYLSWLRLATKVHFPFIRDGTFATHVYHHSFDEHVRIKSVEDVQRAQGRQAAVPPLAEKYGSLGWGNLYREVSEKAWVQNYRVGIHSYASDG